MTGKDKRVNKDFATQLKTIANKHGFRNRDELAYKAGLEEKRVREILLGDEPSVTELYGLAIALESDFGTLASCMQNNKMRLLVLRDVNKLIEHEDAEDIVALFVTGKIMKCNEELYFANIPGLLTKRISNEDINRIFDLLMKHGYVNTVMKYSSQKCMLSIKSLSDLDKYGVEIKDKYLYGSFETVMDKADIMVINLPEYFISLANSVPEAERAEVMEEVERRIGKRNDSIKKLMKKGLKLEHVSKDDMFVANGNAWTLISRFDFSEVIGCKDIIGRIDKRQDELFGLKKEENI